MSAKVVETPLSTVNDYIMSFDKMPMSSFGIISGFSIVWLNMDKFIGHPVLKTSKGLIDLHTGKYLLNKLFETILIRRLHTNEHIEIRPYNLR